MYKTGGEGVSFVMSEKYQPNISKRFLDEYFYKVEMRKKLQAELSEMSNFIKKEMENAERKEIELHGYYIDVETKFEPNDDFFKLIYKYNLQHLLTNSISGNRLKSAKKKMGMDEETYYNDYVKEKDTKWLHVRK